MKFKLDENFGVRTQRLFRESNHDVETVRDENLQGAPDERLYSTCCLEQRCLVTLDLDFADVTRFPPKATGGIVVIRVPRNPSLTLLEDLIRQLLRFAIDRSVVGQLWIVEPGRVRLHQTASDE
jgi:predicted nuclease of predicted toxin-antitoxin system